MKKDVEDVRCKIRCKVRCKIRQCNQYESAHGTTAFIQEEEPHLHLTREEGIDVNTGTNRRGGKKLRSLHLKPSILFVK